MKAIMFMLLLVPFMAIAQKPVIQEKVKFLALGDSYTIGQSVAEADRWPNQLVAALRTKGLTCFDPKIIAATGWRTDNLQNAIVNAHLSNDYSLVSLLIGVNNYYQGRSVTDYKPEFEALLVNVVALAGGDKSKVFVISIPDYGYTPFGKSNQTEISKGIDSFNDAAKTITEKHEIAFINITDISRRGLAEQELIAGDGLHPSGKMYAAWVARILESADIIEDSGINTTDPVTGISQETFGVLVHPNPFANTFIIDGLPENTVTLQITDMKGTSINYQSSGSTRLVLDTSTMSAGLYYYRLQSHSGTLGKGMIVKESR